MSERIPKPLQWAAVAGLAALALTSCRPDSKPTSPTPESTISFANADLINLDTKRVKPADRSGDCLVGIWDAFGRPLKGDIAIHPTHQAFGTECPANTEVPASELSQDYLAGIRGAQNDWNRLALEVGKTVYDKGPGSLPQTDFSKTTQRVTLIGHRNGVQALDFVDACIVNPTTSAEDLGTVAYEGKELEIHRIMTSADGTMCTAGDIVLTLDPNSGILNA